MRFLGLILLTIATNNCVVSLADDCSKVTNALSICNQYVKSLEGDAKLLHQKVDLLSNENKKLVGELEKAEENSSKSTLFWFIVGAAAGAVVGVTATKH